MSHSFAKENENARDILTKLDNIYKANKSGSKIRKRQYTVTVTLYCLNLVTGHRYNSTYN